MAHTIIERPNAFSMSKNDIRYVYRVTDLSRVGLYLEVQLYYYRTDDTTQTFISFPSFKLTPNNDGSVYVYLQQYLDSILQYVLPTTNNVTLADKQACVFYVQTREVCDATVGTVPFISPESAYPRVALKMGMEKNRYSRNNLFNYFANNNLFFTWQPSKRLVFANQPNYLSFLVPSGTPTGYQLKVVFQTIEGTNDDIIVPLDAPNGYFFHIKTDPTSLGIVVPLNERLLWYDVSILDADNLVLVGSYRYLIDYDTFYHYHDFIYNNSLGGFDTARAKGEVSYEFDRAIDEIEGGFDVNDWNAVVKNAETTFRAVNLRRIYKGDLGFRRSTTEQDSMMELLASTAVYEILDSRYVPLLHIQKSQSLRKTTDMLLPFAIEWQHAETNETYTPIKIPLGIGNDTETYNGYVFLENASYRPINAVGGLAGFALNTNVGIGGEVTGVHTAPTNVNQISITPLYVGSGSSGPFAWVNLYVNGVLIETDEMSTAEIIFTTDLPIAQTDVIEISVTPGEMSESVDVVSSVAETDAAFTITAINGIPGFALETAITNLDINATGSHNDTFVPSAIDINYSATSDHVITLKVNGSTIESDTLPHTSTTFSFTSSTTIQLDDFIEIDIT